MKKKQDHIIWTLEAKSIDHQHIDIADPNFTEDKEFMQENVEMDSDEEDETPLPPQIFNEEKYIGVNSYISTVITQNIFWNNNC